MNALTHKLFAVGTIATFVAGGLVNVIPTTTRASQGIITNEKIGISSAGTFADSAQASPGDAVEFRVFLQNDTGSNGVGPEIIDTLNPGLTYIAGSSMLRIKEDNEDKDEVIKDSNIKFEGQKMTWKFTDMASRPDTALYLHFMARVTGSYNVGNTTLSNCAISTLNNGALSKETNCVQLVVNKLANPTVLFDLRTEVTNRTLGDSKWYVDQLASAAPGDKVSFRLSLVNTGNTPAQNVNLKELLPAGLTYAGNMKIYSNAYPNGQPISGSALVQNGYVIPTLTNGSANYIQVVFDATVSSSCAAKTLKATTQVAYAGSVKAQKDAGLIASCTRGLIITKDVLNPATNKFEDKIGTVPGNSTLTYRINVQNNGTTTIKNPTVRDVLPAGAVYVPNSLKIDGEVMSQATQNYFLHDGVIITDLSPGLGKVITLQVQVACIQGNNSAVLTNTAYVKANNTEISDTAQATIAACNQPTPTPTPPVVPPVTPPVVHPPVTPPVTPPTHLPQTGPEAGIALVGLFSGAGAVGSRFYLLKKGLKKSLENLTVL